MTDQTESRAAFRVFGRVQGVGFRWWTHRTASGLGLAGSVRNMPDGTVEVRARGTPEAIRQLESRLNEGPPSARVRQVERREIADQEVARHDFRIER